MTRLLEKLTKYQLEPLGEHEAARWDQLIEPYESRQLFHRKVWLDYLSASRGAEIRMWAIRDGARRVGYFCGGVLRKGPFRVLGSPMKGWGTNFMGPLVNSDFDQVAFFRAVDELAAAERFAMVEIENPILADEHFKAFGYVGIPQPTYIVTLIPHDPATMWKRLTQRTQVRKALKSGVTVEDTNDPTIADEFYDQFLELMTRKGLHPPYNRRCPQLLFKLLKPLDLLLAVRVRGPQGDVLATGLFPHDDTTIYFWGGASRREATRYSPNDLLHWKIMEIASAQGLRVYNMCGHGFFKRKFGGTLHELHRWHKYYGRTARWGRRGYELYFQRRLQAQAWWRRRVLSGYLG